MRAMVVHGVGGPDVLQAGEIDVPEPGPGQVRVRLEAAGVNFIDVYHRSGVYPLSLPAVPGMEGAGVVDATGPDVTTFDEGDRVAFTGVLGAYAEQAVVPVGNAVTVPDDIDLPQAGALALQGLTAHFLATTTYALGPEHRALVLAAAGGVGHLLVQIACLRGAEVIAAVSTAEKEELARAAGAAEVVRYRDVPIDEGVAELTGGEGVDVVYDSVGADTFERGLACLRRRGTLVLYGQSSGPVPPVDPEKLRTGSLYLTRPGIGDHIASREELDGRAADLFGWVRDGRLRQRIDQIWPLAEAGTAHAHVEAGRTTGKVLLLTR